MKNKIIQITIGSGIFSLFTVQTASANAGGEGIFSASTIFNLFLLIGAVLCLLAAVKILSLVRGGLLSKGWQMFVLGFASLVLAQVLIVSQKAHILPMPEFVAVILYLVMAGTWLAGLYQIRKALT